MTREDMSAVFSRRWPGKQLVFADSRGVDMHNLGRAMADLDRNMERYPAGAEHLTAVYVDTKSDIEMHTGRGTVAYWNPLYRQIHVSSTLVNDGDRSYDKVACVRNGWHPKGCDTVAASLAHEFGHAIDYAVYGRPFIDPEPGSLEERWCKFLNTAPVSSSLVKASGYAESAYFKSTQPHTRGGIHHRIEGVAEAFSQLSARESGYYKGEITEAAAALERFFREQGMMRREGG